MNLYYILFRIFRIDICRCEIFNEITITSILKIMEMMLTEAIGYYCQSLFLRFFSVFVEMDMLILGNKGFTDDEKGEKCREVGTK